MLTILADGEKHRFDVEIADEGDERARGLMFRRDMPRRAAMLFDFEESRPVSMWMKNTLLPLDMIFAREDGTVVRVASDTTPLSTEAISSGEPVRYVVEVNAGLAASLGIARGAKLVLPDAAGE